MNGSQEASGKGTGMEVSPGQKPDAGQRERERESEAVDMQKKTNEASLYQCSLQQSYERIQCLEYEQAAKAFEEWMDLVLSSITHGFLVAKETQATM